MVNLRLQDGVLLQITVSLKWKIEDQLVFNEQFASPESFNQFILHALLEELGKAVTNTYEI